ncbi:MAG: hypothetical protein Q8O90_09730 [Elusimicrobiota bacterium]|nr:hypothetical protein [Elusimicrobiota bacterium]
MKNFTTIVGWLLLVAVLAVPSFLFYNWLSKSKRQNQAELAHEPMAGSVFPFEKSGQPAGAQQAPAAASRQAVKADAPRPAPQAPAVQPDKALPASRPAAETDGPIEEQAPSASSNPPAAAPQSAQAPAVSTAAQLGEGQSQVAVSTGPRSISYYNPKTARDPTFTPDDYRRIKEEQRQREEAERLRLEAERNKPREPGPETRISLQGIVGSAAIINGDMYSVGQTVRGVKILRIGADYIIAEYKGKKFKKVLK